MADNNLDNQFQRILDDLAAVRAPAPAPASAPASASASASESESESEDDGVSLNRQLANAGAEGQSPPASDLISSETESEPASAPAPTASLSVTPTPTWAPVPYGGISSFVSQTIGNSWSSSATVISHSASFLKGVLNLVGLRFHSDAQMNDYSLGFFLYLLKLSMLVILNYTLNASIWTGIIQAVKDKKFPGNSRVDPLFLVLKLANEELSFPTTLYDKTSGTRQEIPAASAALFGILTAAVVSQLFVLLAYALFKMKQSNVSISPGGESEPLIAPTPILPPTLHPFVNLVDRYNKANIRSRTIALVVFSTLGTLFNFAAINGVALSKISYPNIPTTQKRQTNSPLDDPYSYMLLLTLGSFAASVLVAIIYGLTRVALNSRSPREFVTHVRMLITEGENPLYVMPNPVTPPPPTETDNRPPGPA